MSPDSWDWLANGLSWSGAPIDASFRPPGLPLVIAALHRLGVLNALPILNFAMLALAAALLYRWIRLRHSAVVAALACLLFVSNGSLFGYVRFVMAEVWTLPFLVAAAIAFTRAAARPRAYITCGLLLGESFLFHYAGAIVALAMAAALLFHRRADLRSRWPWLGLLSAMPLPAIWLVLRAQH
ncbi:MAG: glycosyltransferase family 39 protein, partial [Thermoanaerobaculia bacterium]